MKGPVMFCIIVLALPTAVLAQAWITNSGQTIANAIENDLRNNAMGYNAAMKALDDATFYTNEINGIAEIERISSTLSNQFEQIFDGVRQLKDAIKESHGSFSQMDITECCQIPDAELEYEAALNNQVDLTNMCYREAEGSKPGSPVPGTQQLFTAFADNYKMITRGLPIKWQYYGEETGKFVIYPGNSREKNCRAYDPRYRPWYPETSTPGDRAVIIILDKSDSMNKTQPSSISLAKNAAKTVIESLNPNDWAGLVTFSSDANTPPTGCYTRKLARATPDNQEALKQFIDKTRAGGGTDYIIALKRAFELFNNSDIEQPDINGEKIILFLTDGRTINDERVLKQLKEWNNQLAKPNSARLMTYGIGKDIADDKDAQDLLCDMANMTKYNTQVADPLDGACHILEDASSLRFKMGTFYKDLNYNSDEDNPIVTVPYTDFDNLGTITSVCLPVIYQTQTEADPSLHGVTCIDVVLSDLVATVSNFTQQTESYTFIIDDKGRALLHPLLPLLSSEITAKTFVDIEAIERGSGIKSVLAAMKRGESGKKTVADVELLSSRGDVKADGIHVVQRPVTYYYRPITKITGFSVCFVHVHGERNLANIEYNKISQHFAYNVFNSLNARVCNQHGAKATTEFSTLKFTEEVFIDDWRHQYKSEDEETLTRYREYMINRDTGNQIAYKFNQGVKEIVALSEQMESFWKMNKTSSFVTQSFFASKNGIIRTYPGVYLDTEFRHYETWWYKRSMYNLHSTVFTPIHPSEFNKLNVITIAQAVLPKILTSPNLDKAVGVVGVDIYHGKLQSIVLQTFSDCQSDKYRCFLFDDSGFLIYHQSISANEDHYNDIHLIRLEPVVASVLIDKNYLRRRSCTDVGVKKDYHNWKISIPKTFDGSNENSPFWIQIVPGTNLYFGVSEKVDGGDSCRCNSEFQTCSNTGYKFCECPCYSDTNFSYCDDKFLTSGTSTQPCTPTSPTPMFFTAYTNASNSTDECFPFVCSSYNTELSCVGAVGCHWCSYTKQCTDGVVICEPGAVDNTVAVAVGSVFAVIIVLCVIVFIAIVIKRKREKRPKTVRHISDNPGSVYNGNESTIYGEIQDDTYNEINSVYSGKSKSDILPPPLRLTPGRTIRDSGLPDSEFQPSPNGMSTIRVPEDHLHSYISMNSSQRDSSHVYLHSPNVQRSFPATDVLDSQDGINYGNVPDVKTYRCSSGHVHVGSPAMGPSCTIISPTTPHSFVFDNPSFTHSSHDNSQSIRHNSTGSGPINAYPEGGYEVPLPSPIDGPIRPNYPRQGLSTYSSNPVIIDPGVDPRYVEHIMPQLGISGHVQNSGYRSRVSPMSTIDEVSSNQRSGSNSVRSQGNSLDSRLQQSYNNSIGGNSIRQNSTLRSDHTYESIENQYIGSAHASQDLNSLRETSSFASLHGPLSNASDLNFPVVGVQGRHNDNDNYIRDPVNISDSSFSYTGSANPRMDRPHETSRIARPNDVYNDHRQTKPSFDANQQHYLDGNFLNTSRMPRRNSSDNMIDPSPIPRQNSSGNMLNLNQFSQQYGNEKSLDLSEIPVQHFGENMLDLNRNARQNSSENVLDSRSTQRQYSHENLIDSERRQLQYPNENPDLSRRINQSSNESQDTSISDMNSAHSSNSTQLTLVTDKSAKDAKLSTYPRTQKTGLPNHLLVQDDNYMAPRSRTPIRDMDLEPQKSWRNDTQPNHRQSELTDHGVSYQNQRPKLNRGHNLAPLVIQNATQNQSFI